MPVNHADVAAPTAPRPPLRHRRQGYFVHRIALLAWLFMIVADAAAARPQMVDIGSPAPAFDLPVFNDGHRRVTLESLRGKVVLLDFWASWCGPCRESFPAYDRLSREWSAHDFVVLAVNLDEMIDGPSAFLEEHPVRYTSVADPAGEIARRYGLIGMPSSFIIDKDGIVRARHVGFKAGDVDELRREIGALLGSPTHAP